MLKVGNKYFFDFDDYENRSFEVNPKDLLSQEIKSLISNLPNDESSSLTIQGNEYFNKQEFYKAIECFTKAIELKNENIKALFYRGLSFLDIEKYLDAIRDLTKAIELKPTLYKALFYRGQARLLLQTYFQIKLAINDFSTVISHNQDNGASYFLRGLCHLLLRQEENAKLDWKKAKDLGIAKQEEERWKEDYFPSNSF